MCGDELKTLGGKTEEVLAEAERIRRLSRESERKRVPTASRQLGERTHAARNSQHIQIKPDAALP
jgi:hypothetical protein